MEIKDIVKNSEIVGIISNYKSNIKIDGKVKDLNIYNIDKALKIVGLEESIKDMNLEDLTLSELWKVELAKKLNDKIIIVGNLSKCLNYKDLEYIKKLLLKLNSSYNKKIIIIDNNVKVFFNLVNEIIVIKNHQIVFKTKDFYDEELYKYTKMPKIIEFIKYVNKNKKRLNNTLDIYELIKDIYRSTN